MVRNCVFCKRNNALTREHVLPDWLSSLYPNEDNVTNEFTGEGGFTWQSKIFQHKVKVVCNECNNGWMSTLENQAKPILTKMFELNNFLLDKKSQDTLSFWAQKTLLMVNQATPNSIKITSDLYDDIFKNKRSSKKVMVNLGYRLSNKGDHKEPITSFAIKQIPTVDVLKELENNVRQQIQQGAFIWKAILAVGPVIFELIGHNMPVVLDVTTNSGVFKTIRPYFTDFNWPLEWPIEAEGGLDSIRERG